MIAHRGRYPPVWLAAALALLPAPTGAQTPAPPTFSLSVTEPYELIEDIGTTRRIGRPEIEARNARTLDEALRLIPGVYVRTGGDGSPRIDVRGFRSRHVLLLVNGVLLNSTADGQFDPARISTTAIREIKVTYGSSSVLYGDNAMAAVIEITTVDDQPDARLHVSAGTPDQKEAGGRFAHAAGPFSLSIAATGFATGGFRLADSFAATSLEDGGRRQNSDRDRGDVRAALGYRLTDTTSLASEWSFGGGSYGVPSGIVDDASDIFAQTPRFERVEDYRAATGQVSIVAAPSPRLNLRAWVFRNRQREDRARYDDATYANMDDALVAGTFQARERTTITGSSALVRVGLERFGSLRLAVNQRRESLDAAGVIRDVPVSGSGGGGGGGGGGRGGGSGTSGPPTFSVRSFSIDRHVDVYSTGVEWQAYPARRLGTAIGAALNGQKRPGSTSEHEPTWIAGLSYAATGTLRVHASASRKIRVPSIDQLFNTSNGNPDLRAETTVGVDVGGEYRVLSSTTVGLSVFSTHARNFIERTSGSPFQNQDRYRFRGAEVTAQTTRIPALDVRGSYSFLDAVAEIAGGTRPLQSRPRHRGSLEWTWRPAAGSSVRGAAYHTGAQLYDSRGSQLAQQKTSGFTLVDVGFTQTFSDRFDIAVDASNLFDRLYDQAYGLPREGRAVVVRVGVRR